MVIYYTYIPNVLLLVGCVLHIKLVPTLTRLCYVVVYYTPSGPSLDLLITINRAQQELGFSNQCHFFRFVDWYGNEENESHVLPQAPPAFVLFPQSFRAFVLTGMVRWLQTRHLVWRVANCL